MSFWNGITQNIKILKAYQIKEQRITTYVLDTTLHEVNITSDGEPVPLPLRNEVFKGSLAIQKVDKDSGQAFAVESDKMVSANCRSPIDLHKGGIFLW